MISGNEVVIKSSHQRKLSPGEEAILNNMSLQKKHKHKLRRSMVTEGVKSEMKNYSPESLTKPIK
jgi:hypothetical protein